jgi:peroxiredoxin
MGAAASAEGPVVRIDALDDFRLPFKGDEQQRAYLGIADQSSLVLSQVHADRLVIIIFNTYCPICQSDAKNLNFVYEWIEQDPDLKGKVKMLGIAVGNTDVEVEKFRQANNVSFPIVADQDFRVDRLVTENLRTPMMVAVNNPEGEPLRLLKTHIGAVKGVEDVLDDSVMRSAALEGDRTSH